MIKKYKNFYPFWYIENYNNKIQNKMKKYLIFFILMNLILFPKLLRTSFNEDKIDINNHRLINNSNNDILKKFNIFLDNNLLNFNITNNKVEFKIAKEDLIVKLNYFRNNLNIYYIKELTEEGLFLVSGELI